MIKIGKTGIFLLGVHVSICIYFLPMTIEGTFEDAVTLEGWSPEEQVDVLLQYIEAQETDENFQIFLEDMNSSYKPDEGHKAHHQPGLFS